MTSFMKVEDSLVHRLFYPQVPLVLSAQFGARVSAMPVVSYASISDKPPLIAVACSPRGYTCKLSLKARAFSLSILDRTQSNAVALLATLSGAKVKDKLREAGLSHVNGKILKVPVIERSVATLECKLRDSSRHGDHLLLVGTVRAAYASEAFTEFWDFGRYRPVLYAGWREGLTTYPES
jgi:flavin reductase (DIM6/NTAB) family NADH-FMN oxidoreductase RutF